MDLHVLRQYLLVVEQGSIRRAASDLGLRQSVLSRRIRRLELTLGVQLLDRSVGGVCPTPAGHEILTDARVIVEAAERLRACAARHCAKPPGPER